MTVRVSVRMTVGVSMGMSVRMSVIVTAVPMIVPVMRVPKSEQSHHVDQKSKRADNKELLHSSQLPPFKNTLSSLPDKFHADQHEENAIAEASKCVELAPTVRHLGASRPLRSNSSAQTHDETQAIEKHMHSVAQQTKRSTQVTIQTLDEHESEV